MTSTADVESVFGDTDPDSGLVEDAFDVLPDEETLALDLDLDLDLSEENFGRCSTGDDFSDLLELDNNLDTSTTDFDDSVFVTDEESILVEKNINAGGELSSSVLNAIIPDSTTDSSVESEDKSIKIRLPDTNVSTKSKVKESNNGKLVSFSKEQARQWRRKRILNSSQKKIPIIGVTESNKGENCPLRLEPLLPLPKNLKPPAQSSSNVRSRSQEANDTEKINPKDKLANPLLGGEKLGTKTKRGPVPMKLRALPESFWKEPTNIQTSSLAGSNYAVLPPLFSSESKNSDLTTIRPVTPPDEKKNSPRHSPRSKKKIIVSSNADTDLLFSLFDHLETNKIDEKLIVRRGRPKKSTSDKVPPPPARSHEEDPCIVDDLANKLFPELSLNQKQNKGAPPNYAMVRINKGSHVIEFPAIKANENYPTILNELVTHM